MSTETAAKAATNRMDRVSFARLVIWMSNNRKRIHDDRLNADQLVELAAKEVTGGKAPTENQIREAALQADVTVAMRPRAAGDSNRGNIANFLKAANERVSSLEQRLEAAERLLTHICRQLNVPFPKDFTPRF